MQFTGKTVDEAIECGLKELNVDKEHAEIIILEEPTKGIFGILKGKAVVEINKKQSEADRTVEFVQGVLDFMSIPAVAEVKADEDNLVIGLNTSDSKQLIAHRGELLDAIQTLAGAAANIGRKDYRKVIVDCENYRNKREDTLINLAKKLEEKATEMRREVILEPMSAYERRIIHTTLAESKTVTTKSDGKEPNRYVVIVPFDKDEFSKPYNAGRNNSDKGRRDSRGGKGGFRNGGRSGKNSAHKSGFIKSDKKPSLSFGTYLGNSLKDKQ